MRIFTLPVAALLLCISSFAQQEYLPLYDHLSEVNSQWLKHSPDAALLETTSFGTDVDRIQKHLELVERNLRQATPADLSPAQRSNRMAMLDVLHTYWQTGNFPINTGHNHRQPYFIDNYGTPCAVGYLVIESGHGTLAQRIHNENNLAYIHELDGIYPELAQWADVCGFTVDELAWIQPAYMSTVGWKPLGDGANGTVNSVVMNSWTPNSYLIAGEFSIFDLVACSNIISWSDGNVNTLSGGLPGPVTSVKLLNGSSMNILATGSFEQQGQVYELAEWENGQWKFYNIAEGEDGMGTAVYDDYNSLYVAGWSINNAQTTHFLKKKDKLTNTWSTIATFNGPVNALAYSYPQGLVIGGAFTLRDGAVSANYITSYDDYNNTWDNMANGLDNEVHTLEFVGDALYAGGRCYDDLENPTFCFAQYHLGQWNRMLAEDALLDEYGHKDGVAIYDITSYNNGLLFSGNFCVWGMMYSGCNIGFYDQHYSQPSAFGTFDGPVHSVAANYQNIAIIGGDFQIAEKGSANRVAILNQGAQGLAKSEVADLHIHPNPATDIIRVQLPDTNTEIKLYDGAGRQVVVENEHMQGISQLDVSRLPAGMYILHAVSETGDVQKGKIVISR